MSNKPIKLLILGNSGIGKSCLLLRFSDNIYHPETISTLGVDVRFRTITIEDRLLRLQLWDAGGQERFRAITSSYYRNSNGIILAYDITNKRSFASLENWLFSVLERANEDIKFVVVGTKCDLENLREVSTAEGQEFANKYGFPFLEVSAKKNINIEKTLQELVSQITTEKIENNALQITSGKSSRCLC